MRFIFDNNLSIYLARAIAALCEPESVVVRHIRERFPEDTPDIDWIDALAAEKDWAVVTQDRLTRNPLEKEALRRSGLTAFILVRGWAHHKEWEKAAQLVRWWPRIMEQADLVRGGAAFQVPWRWTGKGRFQQIRL